MSAIALTPEQDEAVHTIDRSVGIVANAGSGKTRVLVERVAHILEAQSIPLRQILVVTFTEKAAQELKQRLSQRLPDRRLELMSAPITTLHGFATRVLRDHAPLLGISEAFRIASEGEAGQLLQRAIESTVLEALEAQNPQARLLCERFSFRSIVNHLTPLLEDRWSFERYVSVRGKPVEPRPSTSSGRTVVDAIVALFQKCSTRYTLLKANDDLLDFHDLEIQCWQLFRDHPEVLGDYQRQFRHLLVDEFQDTNPLQATIIRQLFTPPDNLLCIVGDPKQSIYRFRRADVSCFAKMLTTIAESGGTTLVLPENFRSRPEIIQFVNTVCAEMPQYTPLIAKAPTGAGQTIITVPVASAEKTAAADRRVLEAKSVAAALPTLAAEADGYGGFACLFQTRSTLQLWADVFRAEQLPVRLYGSGGYWERREIRGLLFCLQVLVGLMQYRPDERHLLALLISPLGGATLDEVYRWMHLLPQQGDAHLPPLHRAVMAHSALGEQLQRWLPLTLTCTPPELLMHILRDTRYLETLQAMDPTGQLAANAESMQRRLHEMGRGTMRPLPLVVAQIVAAREISERAADTPATLIHDNAIQLMTIHAAKGNEFPSVILPDLFRRPQNRTPQWIFEPDQGLALRYESEYDPEAEDTAEWTTMRDQHLEEEAAERDRLLYVALTRARDRLILPIHPDMKDTQKGRAIWHEFLRQ